MLLKPLKISILFSAKLMSSVELGIMLFEASIQMDRMCKNFELFSSDWGKSIGTVYLYILSIKGGLPL